MPDDSLSDGDEPQLSLASHGGDPQDGDEGGASGRSYSSGTPLDRGQRLHELFPARYLTISLVTIGGLAAVALLEMLHLWTRSLGETSFIKLQELAALDLGAPGNVSGWFAAMLLWITALVAIFVYSLRRHRLDDYHGRYRVWLWTAGGCLLASLGESTTLGTLGRGLCRSVADVLGLANSVVWPVVLAIPLAALAIRLLIEVRRCRLAAAALTLGATGWLIAAAVDCELFAVGASEMRPLVIRGSWLAGYVLLVTALLLYTRHVMREIAGLIAAPPVKVRRKKKRRQPAEAPSTTDGPAPRRRGSGLSDLDPVPASAGSAPVGRPHFATGSQSATRQEATYDDDDEDTPRHLSKAERKRLRREARRSA